MSPDDNRAVPLITVAEMRAAQAVAVGRCVEEVISPLEYYSETARQSEIAKYTSQELALSVRQDPFSVLIALKDDDVAGFCLSHVDDGIIWLSWIGVSPSFRGCGIAGALLRRLEETVRPRQCHKIWCDCRTNNVKSKSLLSAVGYRIICTVENHWYGHDYYLWERIINP
jgi:ribosomal protein S18 acetylase RimI-like enzyme